MSLTDEKPKADEKKELTANEQAAKSDKANTDRVAAAEKAEDKEEVFGSITITLAGSLARLTPTNDDDEFVVEVTSKRPQEEAILQARAFLQNLKPRIEAGDTARFDARKRIEDRERDEALDAELAEETKTKREKK